VAEADEKVEHAGDAGRVVQPAVLATGLPRAVLGEVPQVQHARDVLGLVPEPLLLDQFSQVEQKCPTPARPPTCRPRRTPSPGNARVPGRARFGGRSRPSPRHRDTCARLAPYSPLATSGWTRRPGGVSRVSTARAALSSLPNTFAPHAMPRSVPARPTHNPRNNRSPWPWRAPSTRRRSHSMPAPRTPRSGGVAPWSWIRCRGSRRCRRPR
jgi:hypothetical protein